MCGIAGYATTVSGDTASPPVEAMMDRMANRGPDAQGLWYDDSVTLGHRRLAIIDLDSRANQPMASATGRYMIVFNGEIYNFRELRALLEKSGTVLRTTSDTEVLVEMFARDGHHMLSRLRGMFAFAIWDTKERELFLARDPYGIKPLYYAQTKNGVAFASQVKGLIASGLVPAQHEPAGVAGFFLWGSVPEPWTIYRDVFALPAGHFVRIRNGIAARSECWSDVRAYWMCQPERIGTHELVARVRTAVTDSVKSHLIADVPVSVFLSAGVDSATVAGVASGLGASVEAITIGFSEFEGRAMDEVPVAAAIARHFGLRHHVRRISIREFEEDLPAILRSMDQPSIDGVNTWFASKAAAERGYKVVLSGIGGDELFCGYSLFQRIPRMAAVGGVLARMPRMVGLMALLCRYLVRRGLHPKIGGLPDLISSVEASYFLSRALFLPDDLPELMNPDFAKEGLARLSGAPAGLSQASARDSVARVALLESTIYLRNQLLRDSDWASMAHSLELRTPLVDHVLSANLAPFAAQFRRGKGKQMLAQSPRVPLPRTVWGRRKTGFNLPIHEWLSKMQNGAFQPSGHPGRTPWARRWAPFVFMHLNQYPKG